MRLDRNADRTAGLVARHDRVGAAPHRAHRAYSISLITFAGEPAAIVRGGRSWVTTELAPITQRSPIVTPLVTTQLAPNQALSPIRTGPFEVKPCQGTG